MLPGSTQYQDLRKLRRKPEKRFKRTKLQEDKEALVNLRKRTTTLAFKKQQNYYVRKIDECKGQRELYYYRVNRLLDKKKELW